jgi:histidinol-phosphate aminotransferase
MTDLPIRKDLIGLKPYGAPQLDVAARLNVNENPFPLSPTIAKAMAKAVEEAASKLNRYPDRDAVKLRTELAKFVNADAKSNLTFENIWPANGSNEVMHQIFQLFGGPGKLAVGFAPTYSMYPDYCRDTFTDYKTVNRSEDFTIDQRVIDQALSLNPDIILLASPNNPTGTILDDHLVTYLLGKFNGIVIVDEAYAEFRQPEMSTSIPLVTANSHLIVTRTMSKAFSCAGLRLGYAVANPEVIAALQIVRLPYHLSGVTQAVAMAALEHSDELLSQVELLRQERNKLASWLADEGFIVAPSGANFILFGIFSDRDQVFQGLLDQGVLIRQTGPAGWLRVSIGTPDENELFRKALSSLELTN